MQITVLPESFEGTFIIYKIALIELISTFKEQVKKWENYVK